MPLSKEAIGTNRDGESVEWKRQGENYPAQAQYALCRCGQSASKPFCDGTHTKVKFDGNETASREPYRKQANLLPGPAMSLTDVETLCAFARFCDPNGQVWNLVNATNNAEARDDFVRQVCDCPSGRLVAWNNATGEAIEPKFEPAPALVDDLAKDCSGPIWARGGVPLLGADEFAYEVRHRMTLCRCGASRNKPFCDRSHVAIGFSDKA